MCPRNFESLNLHSYFSKSNQIFFITRGRLVTFFPCSEINTARNNELYIREEDVVKWTYRIAEKCVIIENATHLKKSNKIAHFDFHFNFV